ncbi:hypothetical protein BACOV975_03172 [Bacteroides ovatus V975]|nr:hypothetical protein BACOV975_03172 [Bacteroides ovatus V975]
MQTFTGYPYFVSYLRSIENRYNSLIRQSPIQKQQ